MFHFHIYWQLVFSDNRRAHNSGVKAFLLHANSTTHLVLIMQRDLARIPNYLKIQTHDTFIVQILCSLRQTGVCIPSYSLECLNTSKTAGLYFKGADFLITRTRMFSFTFSFYSSKFLCNPQPPNAEDLSQMPQHQTPL